MLEPSGSVGFAQAGEVPVTLSMGNESNMSNAGFQLTAD